MKKLSWTLILALVMGLCVTGPSIAQEIDLSGTWTMTMLTKSPTGDKEATLSFEQDGFSLAVNMKGASGEVDCVGYIDGKEVRFFCVTPGKKGETVAKFRGHIRGDLMGGEVDLGKQPTTWKATKGEQPSPDLTGNWTLQMRGESPSGMDRARMSFRQEGHNLVVTLENELGSVECEGFLAGRVITFFYVRATNGDQFVAKFTGQLAGALMGGEVDMGKLGKTTWRATQNI
jgi:hypothetical protein